VTVQDVDLTGRGEIVAYCSRGRFRQAISILDLPLPAPPPEGAEWIDAYRRWAWVNTVDPDRDDVLPDLRA
jgi:hypothetical protein